MAPISQFYQTTSATTKTPGTSIVQRQEPEERGPMAGPLSTETLAPTLRRQTPSPLARRWSKYMTGPNHRTESRPIIARALNRQVCHRHSLTTRRPTSLGGTRAHSRPHLEEIALAMVPPRSLSTALANSRPHPEEITLATALFRSLSTALSPTRPHLEEITLDRAFVESLRTTLAPGRSSPSPTMPAKALG